MPAAATDPRERMLRPVRHDTDELPAHDTGPAWTVSHEPQPEPLPSEPVSPVPPRRPKGLLRPHKRYATPHEMWSWHWVRMRVVLAWTAVGVSCSVAGTAATEILHEFI